MPAPVFLEPKDNAPNGMTPISNITQLVIESDADLFPVFLVVEDSSLQDYANHVLDQNPYKTLDDVPSPVVYTWGLLKGYSRKNAIYTIKYDGKTELRAGRHYLIAVFNKENDKSKFCTIKEMIVDNGNNALIRTPERIVGDPNPDAKRPTVSILAFERKSNDNAYIACGGGTNTALYSVTLIENVDDYTVYVYTARNIMTGPNVWSCEFRVGNYGVGSRTFTLHVSNTGNDTAQQTKIL